MSKDSKFKLLVLDIDNTVFDWVCHYVNVLGPCLIRSVTGVSSLQLASECKKSTKEGTIEYPFVVQQLPSVLKYYNGDIDKCSMRLLIKLRYFLKTSQKYLLI